MNNETTIPKHYKAIFVKTETKGYTLRDVNSSLTWKKFYPEQDGETAISILNRMKEAYKRDDEVLGWNEIFIEEDGVKITDLQSVRELMSNNRKWQNDLYSEINGNSFGIFLVIFNNTLKEVYFVCDDENMLSEELEDLTGKWLMTMELFKLDREFSEVGGYHSDSNRFAEMINRFGWDIAFKMIKAEIEVIKDIKSKNRKLKQAPTRTHGDDDIFNDYHSFNFHTCGPWLMEYDLDSHIKVTDIYSNIQLRYSLFEDKVFAEYEVIINKVSTQYKRTF